MFHKYCYCIIALMLSFGLDAKTPAGNSLNGKVRDANGEAIVGAVVELPDLKVGTVTDSNGYYYISDLPKGKFAVVASSLSYSQSTITIDISGDAHQDFVLTQSAIETHEVVITGQSKATEIRRNPTPIEIINSQYLKNNLSTNIVDAIAEVPGVAEVSTGPNVSKPVIRGLGYNRVLTLYNGMRQEGQQWGEEHGIEIDEYNIDRVELIKGPSSLIYGSDAVAGVVNMIPTPHAPEGKIVGEALAEYQTNNGQAGISGMVSGNRKKGFYWLGRISHKQAKDYRDPVDGRVYATNYSETDASGAFGVNKKWGFAHVDMSLYDDLQAIPDGSRDSATRRFTKQITEADTFRPIVSDQELNSYKFPTLHQHVQHYRVLSSNSFNVLNGFLVVNAGFERNIRQEFSHPEYGSVAGLYLELNSYTYDVRYRLKSIEGWDISAGMNGMYQANNVTKGTDFIIPSYHQFDFGPFAVFEKTIDKLNLSGGARFDSRSFHNDGLVTKKEPGTGFERAYTGMDTTGTTQLFQSYNHSFSGFTYSLGGTYLFSKMFSVKANIARGFRAPNIVEISANGLHPGSNIYQRGNPGFRPEFSLQEDIGITFTSPHVSIDVSTFNNSLSNYIYNQKTGSARSIDTFQYVQGNARLYGGEASIDIHPHPLDWLHFENSASLVYALNRGVNGKKPGDSARYLPFIPPPHFISELRVDLKRPARNLQNAFVKIQAVIYAAQNRVYLADNTETRTPGYTLINAGAGSDFCDKKGKKLLNVSLFANNLFNVAYQDHLSRLKYFEPYPDDPRGHYGIYNMGRNIGIKVTVPIGA